MAAWRRIGVGLVVLGACMVPGANGDDATRAPARSGMQAHVDPQTGRFVPEPTERPHALPSPTRPPLETRTMPSGETVIKFDDRFHSTMTATVGPDGKVHLGCAMSDGDHVHAGH